MEPCVAILLLTMLEEAVRLMEEYASGEAGLYLIPHSWKKKGEPKGGPPSHGLLPLQERLRDMRWKDHRES